MNAETAPQNTSSEAKACKNVVAGEAVVGFAVLGCLSAGTIGIYKAMWADGFGAAACLLASVVAFGMVCYIYFRKG